MAQCALCPNEAEEKSDTCSKCKREKQQLLIVPVSKTKQPKLLIKSSNIIPSYPSPLNDRILMNAQVRFILEKQRNICRFLNLQFGSSLALTDTTRESNSFTRVFERYLIVALKLGMNIKWQGRRVGSVEVYPLILTELQGVFKDAGIEIILYGSAALWLEKRPRPDKTPYQVIKDLDMCLCLPDASTARELVIKKAGLKKYQNKTPSGGWAQELIRLVVRETIVGSVIDWENEKHVFTSNQGTMEFISDDELVQFSFSLQSFQEFQKIKSISANIVLPFTGVKFRCTGLKYIASGLIGDESMFRKTLFRSDKTRKILTYACLCVGYGELKCKDVIKELISFFADDSDWSEKQRQIMNISVNRHDKQDTEFRQFTQPLIQKLSDINKFKGNSKNPKFFNATIETDYVEQLQLVEQSMGTSEERREMAQWLRETLASLDIAMTQQEAGKIVAEAYDLVSYNAIQKLLATDLMDIWEGEVGSGILIFLMEQFAFVLEIINDCEWIDEFHRYKLQEGHTALTTYLYLKIEKRFN